MNIIADLFPGFAEHRIRKNLAYRHELPNKKPDKRTHALELPQLDIFFAKLVEEVLDRLVDAAGDGVASTHQQFTDRIYTNFH